MTPRELWLRRILYSRGVRPVGHADPRDDEDQDEQALQAAPVVPVPSMPPAPGWPPAGTRRISRTAPGRLPDPGHTIDLSTDTADEPRAEEPVEDDVTEQRQDDGEAEAPAAPPPPAEPVEKPQPSTRPVRIRLPRRGGDKSLGSERSFRITVFNLSAAAVGYMTPLAGIIDTYLRAAEQAARGVFAFVLALGAGFGAWWITRHPAVQKVLPYPFVARPLIVFGCAEIGRRLAPAPVEWLNAHGARWGLGPDAVSLLITAGGISFALWWFIDRKLRHAHWTVRWICRVPLATAVVATLRYGNPT